MKKLFMALILVGLAASVALAGVTISDLIIEIVPEVGVDINLNDYIPGGMVVDSIIVKTSAPNDTFAFREGSATGPRFFPAEASTGGSLIFYSSGGVLHPYLKWTDCSWATPGNVVISIKRRY